MSYTKLTDFAAKDALLSGNPSKLLRGTEIDAEFSSLQTELTLLAPKTGIGATGTWGISVTGNAATATSATNATNATNTTNATNVTGTIASAVTATTQSVGDNSTKVATTAFVRSVGPSYGGITGFSANTTLTSANYGNFIYVNGTFTLTLPVADAANIGRTITCYGYAAASVTVATQSSQLLHYQGTNTATSAVMIGAGDTVTFVNYNGSAWMAMGTNALGTGQTWQNVTGSRAYSTTYYNTTGRPIMVSTACSGSTGSSNSSVTVNGVVAATMGISSSINLGLSHTVIVPPGASYSATSNSTLATWVELR